MTFNDPDAMFIELGRDDAMMPDHPKARVATRTRPLARPMETFR
ncbi:hypothetical protein [Rubellimicrobium mesophilum]|nr:hypothetical protein [Rubellimicrobium mesophilum]